MLTIIAHFFNEERLLPWWIKHHLPLCHHAILIDHRSTDDSCRIIRELAPHWEVMPSRLSQFDAVDTDFEVMQVEARLQGWKIALNVTEFLYAPDLQALLRDAQSRGVMAMKTRGVVMVDHQPSHAPDPSRSLLSQKHFGYIEEGWRYSKRLRQYKALVLRERVLHRYTHGAYTPGRHTSFRPIDEQPRDLFTLWYGYSPWCDWFKARKTAIGSRVPDKDKQHDRGVHHLRSIQQLDIDHAKNLRHAYDLSPYIPGLPRIGEPLA